MKSEYFTSLEESYTTRTMTICHYLGSDTYVQVPHELGGVPVRTIGNEAFSNHHEIESITITSGITKIGDGALANCTGLIGIEIPDSVTEIGKGAFEGCTGLRSAVLPKSITKIEKNTFSNCTSLINAELQHGTRIIEDYAFWKCSSLKNIVLPDTVTSTYDFLLQRSKNQPERMCLVINKPTRSNMENVLFSWNDTKSARKKDSKLIVFLNDENDIPKRVEDGYLNYDVDPIKWSERFSEKSLSALSA